MNYLVLLGKTPLLFPLPVGTVRFQTALYSLDITTLTPAILWTFFLSVNCFLMIISLIITAFGINWTLQIEKSEDSKVNVDKEDKEAVKT